MHNEKIKAIVQTASCGYYAFKEKQISQRIRFLGLTPEYITSFVIDPYQYQNNMAHLKLPETPSMLLNCKDFDILLDHLMPDTSIQITIITQQL